MRRGVRNALSIREFVATEAIHKAVQEQWLWPAQGQRSYSRSALEDPSRGTNLQQPCGKFSEEVAPRVVASLPLSGVAWTPRCPNVTPRHENVTPNEEVAKRRKLPVLQHSGSRKRFPSSRVYLGSCLPSLKVKTASLSQLWILFAATQEPRRNATVMVRVTRHVFRI